MSAPLAMTRRQAAIVVATMQMARPTLDAMTQARTEKGSIAPAEYFGTFVGACEAMLAEFPSILERITGEDVARKLIESIGGAQG